MTEKLEYLRRENMRECGFGVDAMKEIRICTECGNPSPSTEAFCRECGCRLPDKTMYDIYKERHTVCPACDTVVAKDSEYCPQCGTKVKPPKTNIKFFKMIKEAKANENRL